MASELERGLQSVPRGLQSNLTVYLQSLDAVVRRLAGLSRGSEKSRAVRQGDSGITTGSGNVQATITTTRLVDGAVTTPKLASGAVTADKLADSSITGKKMAPGSIDSRELAPESVGEKALQAGAVTTSRLADAAVTADKLADASVTSAKLAPGLLFRTVQESGTAADGELIHLQGSFTTMPLLAISGISLPFPADMTRLAEGKLQAALEPVGRDSETGLWSFSVRCRLENTLPDDTTECLASGTLVWTATGETAAGEEEESHD